jgi:hypothetical protein
MSGRAHEYRSLVLRFGPEDVAMQESIDKELTSLGNDGWDLVAFTTQLISDADTMAVLHTFAFRRVRMAGPRAGS